MLLTTGERISMALLCMALADLGIEAMSFTGSQVGIITDTVARQGQDPRGQGRPGPRRRWPQGKVCVVAGFQGVSTDKEITTLGRGGSDTTAVGAGRGARAPTRARSTPTSPACSPPTRASCRRPASSPTSTSTRCSRWPAPAARCSRCAASSSPATTTSPSTSAPASPGSRARGSPIEEPSMEDPIISGVVTDISEAKVTILAVPDRPGISAALFEPLAAANVNVDMIVQNTSTDGHTDISFTMPKADMGVAESIVSRVAARDRRDGRQPRRRHRQDQPGRRRHEDQPRHRRQDVPHARRRGRQHRDDLDVDDPDQRRHRGVATSSAPRARCTPRSGSTRGQAYCGAASRTQVRPSAHCMPSDWRDCTAR